MEIRLFNFESQQVRVVTIDGDPWFVGKDVATILGYARTADALKVHVAEEDKGVGEIQTPGGIQKMIVINESGLYSLILRSKLPSAEKFSHWVTSEVLPSIRKHGVYMTDSKAKELVTNPNSLADLLQQASDQLREKDAQIADMKPKALFADSVASSHSDILVGQLAKIVKAQGLNIGQNRAFTWLRDHGYVSKRKGIDWNMPTQKSLELGVMRIKESTGVNPDGSVRINKTTLITGKGQPYFVNKMLNDKTLLGGI